jgi:hypothetical protein
MLLCPSFGGKSRVVGYRPFLTAVRFPAELSHMPFEPEVIDTASSWPL